MSFRNSSEPAKLNLNLLPVIVALAEEGTVSAAARKLHMSQPFVSSALGKLRRSFGDPLFVRTARGMEPTPRAQALLQPVRVALGVVENEVLRVAAFDPATSEKTISIVLSGAGEMVFLPAILARLNKEAPNVNVRSVSLDATQLERSMELGDVDLALGYFPDLKGNNFYQQRLMSDRFICLLRADHPIEDSRLTLKQFNQLGHAVVHAEGRSQEVVERFLVKRGISRRIVLHTPHFMSIPHIVAKSDLAATVPLVVGTAFAQFSDVRLIRPPFRSPRFAVRQHWHRKFHHDARSRWLRGVIHSLFNESVDDRRSESTGGLD